MHEPRRLGHGFLSGIPSPAPDRRIAVAGLLFALLLINQWQLPTRVTGQEVPGDVPTTTDDAALREAESKFEEAMSGTDATAAPVDEAVAKATPEKEATVPLLSLVFKGGWLMIPIGIMSLVVGIFGIERAIGMRRSRVIPTELVAGLGQLANRKGGLDPRLAYRLCQKYPSTASNVIRGALLKVGRPHNEVEQAVTQASEREASLLYKNVRPIALAVAITPLIGLLGTVWGMIEAFAVTSESVGGAKAAELARGIYVALVTTVGGLSVAIPAAVLAHYFEGRIQDLFRDIDDVVQSLLPQLERYEGKLRVTKWDVAGADGDGAPAREAPPAAGNQPQTVSGG